MTQQQLSVFRIQCIKEELKRDLNHKLVSKSSLWQDDVFKAVEVDREGMPMVFDGEVSEQGNPVSWDFMIGEGLF